jgi:hypothetical protein
VSAKSILLPGVATGARGNCTALARIAPQDANLIVIAHQALKLAQHHLPHELWQMIIQCIPVYLKSVILAMLTLIDQGIVVVSSQGGVQIHPAAAGHAEDFAAHLPPSFPINSRNSAAAAACRRARPTKSFLRASVRAFSAQVVNPCSASRVTANSSLRVTMV